MKMDINVKKRIVEISKSIFSCVQKCVPSYSVYSIELLFT